MLYPQVQTPFIDSLCMKHTVVTGAASVTSIDLGTDFAGEDIILAITGHSLSDNTIMKLEDNVIQSATPVDRYIQLDVATTGYHLDVYWHDANP